MEKEKQLHNHKNMIGWSNVFKGLRNGFKHQEQLYTNRLSWLIEMEILISMKKI